MKKALLAAVVLLAGCENTNDPEHQQRRWKELDIHDYQFVYNVSCFCGFVGPNPALITVRNDVVTRVEYINSPGSGTYPTKGFPTIDSLFARITRADENGADFINVDYDDTYRFPKWVFVDHTKNAIDDEVTYSAGNFVVLTPGSQ